MYKNVEIRKLPRDALCKIVNILEINDDWKRVMSLIPKNLQSEDFEPKYNSEHIRMIEEYAKATNQKCADIFMVEWSTTGRFRPTLSTLKEILIKALVFRAADEIAIMLNESLPARPSYGSDVPVPINVTEILNDEEEQKPQNLSTVVKSNTGMIKFPGTCSNKMEPAEIQFESDLIQFPIHIRTQIKGIDSVLLADTKLIDFDYGTLDKITGNFSEFLINKPNHGLKGKIGRGGFGDVFVGKDSTYGMLAVKKAHSHFAIHRRPRIDMKIFNAEVRYLSQFRHINIVPILGFSMNGPAPCIVCEYIDGGTLQENIEAKILNELQRINVMIGTAEGLKYLHTRERHSKGSSILNVVGESDSQYSTKHFVHGNVKTANILLTRTCVPKLCDFCLAKHYDSKFGTTYPMGTSAYMAPEILHGTITQKIDIFSFGIVLLELLTGLKPILENDGENTNINHYVEDNAVNNDITPLLDPVVKMWMKADKVFNLAKMCLQYDRKSRPTIVEVCDVLDRIEN